MNIALIGYGMMGKAIEEIALERGHKIVAKINSQNPIEKLKTIKVDVAIEFTLPDVAVENISFCLDHKIPVVVGTTAWDNKLPIIKEKVKETDGSLLHASNFSVGVNLLFALNRKLAQLISPYPEYKVSIEEIHHTQKLDAPSGTAISLANQINENHAHYAQWELISDEHLNTPEQTIPISALRMDNVPGTHTIAYQSEIDTLQLKHTAHNRKGFAFGAVIAAEFLKDKKGIFTMSDVLNL